MSRGWQKPRGSFGWQVDEVTAKGLKMMGKMIGVLVVGLLIGGTAGYFGGSTIVQKEAEETLTRRTAEVNKAVGACNSEKEKLEADLKNLESQLKVAESEIKLNEDRPGFISSQTLSAPAFSPADAKPLNANKKGEVLVRWTPVKGAKKYLVKIEDQVGSVVHTSEIEGETYVYVNLKTKSANAAKSAYYVRLVTINGLDQEGPPSELKLIQFGNKVAGNTKATLGKKSTGSRKIASTLPAKKGETPLPKKKKK